MQTKTFWRETGNGVELFVQAKPSAKKTGVLGVREDEKGQPWLQLGVKAKAEDGKANAELTALIAKLFNLRRADIELISPPTHRQKRFLLRNIKEICIA